uniref:Uncharacterized protein n=1 Tax=Lepeophtheirus salmonis TaxID=72036 RepID=A0A0K2V8G9_LEPSM
MKEIQDCLLRGLWPLLPSAAPTPPPTFVAQTFVSD